MERIYEILKKYYGYDSFRSGQEDIIRAVISGRDVSAVMPTGAGKSLCYQIPALCSAGITIVISPLISLMQDQVRSLISMGVRAAYLNSSLTFSQLARATENAKRGMYKIIYAAPERLESPDFIDFACNADIPIIAVDEAHCISQWGHDFRPSYTRISDFIEKLPKRPVIAAFTATATGVVKNDIISQLHLRDPYTITTGFDRKNLYFGVYKPMDRTAFMMDYVEANKDKSGIIYCGTRKTVDELAMILIDNGYSALPYHAGMDDVDRTRNQEDFIYDRAKIMVATTAFGMGIDKPDVRYVLHYNMPKNIEDYYQQAGRAGRDGDPSECILLYSPRDVKLNEYLIDKSAENEDVDPVQIQKFIEMEKEKLRQMTFYSTSQTVCLRKRILTYFGESFRAPCHNCSVCRKENNRSFVRDYVKRRKEKQELIIDEALCDRLTAYRSKTALRQGVPVYSVLQDSVLRELSAFKPRNLSELSDIKGIGEVKLKRYGNDILEIINTYEDEAEF